MAQLSIGLGITAVFERPASTRATSSLSYLSNSLNYLGELLTFTF
jgi:hypothetical protein